MNIHSLIYLYIETMLGVSVRTMLWCMLYAYSVIKKMNHLILLIFDKLSLAN